MNRRFFSVKPIGILLLCLTAGCALFEPSIPVELAEPPQERPVPPTFRAVQSVVFSFYGRNMTGIGVLSLDRNNRSFELSCMTPMGTKLFDLRMNQGEPEVLFALPFFTEKEGFAEAVALDIARIFFDMQPAVITRAFRKGESLQIESKTENGVIRYVYQGFPLQMNEKYFIRKRELEARIEYRSFFEQDGFRCVGEASLKSEAYGYRLTVRTKELTTEK